MKIHKAGIIPILLVLSGVVIILTALNLFLPAQTLIHYFVYAVAVIFMFMVVRFFRFPARSSEMLANAVYSGADGKVVAIEKVHVEEYFDKEMIQVSVFMSVLNVHINWSPIGGTVVYRKHHNGKHMVAFNPKSSLINEHTSVVFRDDQGREVMMRQIAGALARRIICDPQHGGQYGQGEPIGMIKFGSRVDLLLPPDANVNVKIGDISRGTQTLIASLA